MSEFFHHIFNTLSNGLLGYIVPFLFVLTIVVFFHELGHYFGLEEEELHRLGWG